MNRPLGPLALIGYIATIFAANWLIARYGLVSVGFGLLAPAGVYMAGLAFSLRDAVQETLGRRWTIAAVLIGAALSAALSGPLALASGAAFLLSESCDMAVYTPLRRRGWLVAVSASNVAGLVVDSALFLWLVFGSLDLLAGQLAGKAWATAVTVGLIAAWRLWAAQSSVATMGNEEAI